MFCNRHFYSLVTFYRAFGVVYDSFTGGGIRKYLNYVALWALHIFWVKMSSLYYLETLLFFSFKSSSGLGACVNSNVRDLCSNPKGTDGWQWWSQESCCHGNPELFPWFLLTPSFSVDSQRILKKKENESCKWNSWYNKILFLPSTWTQIFPTAFPLHHPQASYIALVINL